MKGKMWLVVLAVCFYGNSVFAGTCPGDVMPNGWCWPTGTNSIGNYLGYNQPNPNYHNRKHLAQDIDANEGDNVYAIADGVVLRTKNDVGGYGGLKNCTPSHADSIPGAGVIIQHTSSNGDKFIALYAHLKNVHVGLKVRAGEKIGEIRNYTACGSRMDHLHFGIRFPALDDSHRWAGYELNGAYYNFVNPINFLNTHYPKLDYRLISEQNVYGQTVSIAWAPADVPCDKASIWSYNETCSAEYSNAGTCQLVYDELKDIDFWKYNGDDWHTIFFGSISDFQELCY